MKVLFLTDGFWPRLGGIETQGFHFVRSMQERGHEYRVLSQRDFPSWKEEEWHEGIFIQRWDFNRLIIKRDLALLQEMKRGVDLILNQFQADLIHLNTSLGGIALAFLLFLKKLSLPIFLTAHAPYVYKEEIPPLIDQIVQSAHGIGCVSNWVFQEMKHHFPKAKEKLRLIYNGLPMPSISLAPLPFSPPVFLFLGRLVPEKGFQYGVAAFALLKKRGSNARLIIAGGGIETASLKAQVQQLGIEDSVLFTGVLSPDQLLATFNQITALIVPSLIESFGLVILEAMQMQRPVIASCVEGIPELIDEGKTGFLVPPADPTVLCTAMETLLQNPTRAIQMGIEGRKRASRFSIEQNVEQFEQFYFETFK